MTEVNGLMSVAGSPTLSGTVGTALGSNESLVVYDVVNGVATKLGTATINGTSWSYTTTGLSLGNHTFKVQVESNANAGVGLVVQSTSVAVVSENAPSATATITAVTDAVGTSSTGGYSAGDATGTITNGGSTDDTKPVVSGTLTTQLSAGEVVRIYDGSTLLGSATVSGTTWTYTPSTALAAGSRSLTAKVENPASGLSTVSAAYVINEETLSTITATPASGNVSTINGVSYVAGSPTLSGTVGTALGANESLVVYDVVNGISTKLGTASFNGTSWSYATTGLSLGSHTFKVQIESTSNSGVAVVAQSLALVVTGSSAPSATATITAVTDAVGVSSTGGYSAGDATGTITNGGSTDDTKPVVSGTLTTQLSAGEVVRIYDGSTLLGSATVSGTTWTYTPSTALSSGAHTLTAKVENLPTGLSTSSASYSINVETLTVQSVYDDVGAVTGNVLSVSSFRTDDSTPLLSGKLAVALGTNEQLGVYDGSTRLGTATLVATGSGYVWNYQITSAQALGQGAHVLNVMVENTANLGVPVMAISSTINVVTSPPTPVAVPTISTVVDSTGSQTGGISNGGSTDDTKPLIKGILSSVLSSGQQVLVYDGTTLLGSASVSGTSWTYSPTIALASGSHQLTAKVVDPSSGVSGVASSAFNLVEQSLSIDSLTDDVGLLTGNVLTMSLLNTDDTLPTISGTLGSALGTNEVLVVYDGTTSLGNAVVTTANGSTTWTFSPTTALTTGTHTLKVQIENTTALGLPVIDSKSVTVLVVDTATPTQTCVISSVADDYGNETGAVTTGTSTDDVTPTLAGTISSSLATGQQVSVYDGSTYLGSATVSGTSWSFIPSTALAVGSHSLTAKVENLATKLASSSSSAFVVNVESLTFTGFASSTVSSGVVSTISSYTKPTLSGSLGYATLGTNERLAVYDGSTYLGNATISGSGSSATWSYTPTTALSNGSHTLKVRIEDSTSQTVRLSATAAVVIDATAASQTTTLDSVTAHLTGGNIFAMTSGGKSADAVPTLSGTISAALSSGQKVAIYDGVTRIGYAIVSNQSWTYTPTAQGVGTHSYTARVESADGALTGTSSTSMTYEVTGSAPTQTVVITDLLDSSGNAITTAQTSASKPTIIGTISGALGSGEVLAVYSDGVQIGTASVSGLSWSYTQATALSDGSHSLTAAVVNSTLATTKGTSSSAVTLNLEATPTATLTMQVNDDVGALTGAVSDSGSMDDGNVTVTGTVTGWQSGGKVQIYDGSTYLGDASVSSSGTSATWTYSATLSTGSHTFKAMFVNSAGASNSANQVSVAFTYVSSDPTFSAIAATDPISGMSVKSLSLTGANQTLNLLSYTHSEIDVINLAGSGGSNLVTLGLADVMQNSTNLFNSTNGWTGAGGTGMHQLVVNGNASDTVKVDTTALAGSWAYAGTTTNGGHTYEIYNNVNGTAQLLLDQNLQHAGAVL